MSSETSTVHPFSAMDGRHAVQRRVLAAQRREAEAVDAQLSQQQESKRLADLREAQLLTQEAFEILPDVARAAASEAVPSNADWLYIDRSRNIRQPALGLDRDASDQPKSRFWVLGTGTKVRLNGMAVSIDEGVDPSSVPGFWSGYVLGDTGTLYLCRPHPGEPSNLTGAEATVLTPESAVFQDVATATRLQEAVIEFAETNNLENTIFS